MNEDRLNGLPTPPLAPQAWCRRVLTAMNQRQVAEREAGHLEMLLTYFIERDPTAEAFAGMLAQYIDDPRRRSPKPRRSCSDPGSGGARLALPFPPLTEVLRTLGGLLDDGDVRYAYLVVAARGARAHLRRRAVPAPHRPRRAAAGDRRAHGAARPGAALRSG